MHSSTQRDLASTAAVAGGPLTALAVSVHLHALTPYILAVAVVVSLFLRWHKRASLTNLVARLFFFCFTFMLVVIIVYPWAASRLGTA